jgi:hypothetical protein
MTIYSSVVIIRVPPENFSLIKDNNTVAHPVTGREVHNPESV